MSAVAAAAAAAAAETPASRGDPRLDPRILHEVHRVVHFPDPKTFVDLPLRLSADVVWARWDERASVEQWVRDCFVQHPGGDAVRVGKEQYVAPKSRTSCEEFEADLHARWAQLRKTTAVDDIERYTMIPLEHPFVVAGGRFRELYYWDSYFVLRGLLASNRHKDAVDLVLNFASLIETYGFVPNGNRKYYLNRSQPPLYVEMVSALFDAGLLNDVSLRRHLVNMGVREWTFFDLHRSVKVSRNGQTFKLSQYALPQDVNTPRPESYTQDQELAQKSLAPAKLYRGLASAAESGWDFSSRWMADPPHLETTDHIVNIIPVCLNAFLSRMESNLSRLLSSISEHDQAQVFSGRHENRQEAMRSVLWCPSRAMWFDWDLLEDKPRKLVAASGFFPLWNDHSMSVQSRDEASKVLEQLVTLSGLAGPGGIAATTIETGQQWDYPNVWPPIQLIVVEGLLSLHKHFPDVGAESAAKVLAKKYLMGAFQGWKRHGQMMEKYDVRQTEGRSGGGGEYEVQTGFGWTNGVALVFLQWLGGKGIE